MLLLWTFSTSFFNGRLFKPTYHTVYTPTNQQKKQKDKLFCLRQHRDNMMEDIHANQAEYG
jgi:hypothetical protein